MSPHMGSQRENLIGRKCKTGHRSSSEYRLARNFLQYSCNGQPLFLSDLVYFLSVTWTSDLSLCVCDIEMTSLISLSRRLLHVFKIKPKNLQLFSRNYHWWILHYQGSRPKRPLCPRNNAPFVTRLNVSILFSSYLLPWRASCRSKQYNKYADDGVFCIVYSNNEH